MKTKKFAVIIATIIIFSLISAIFLNFISNPTDAQLSHSGMKNAVDKGYLIPDENSVIDASKTLLLKDTVSVLLRYSNQPVPQNDDELFSVANKIFPLAIDSYESLYFNTTDEVAAYMIVETLLNMGVRFPETSYELSEFYSINEKYAHHASIATDCGIFAGGKARFYPQSALTNARFAVILERMDNYSSPYSSMLTVILPAVISCAVFLIIFKIKKPFKKSDNNNISFPFLLFLLFAILLRIFIGAKFYGHSGDMSAWVNWPKTLVENPFSSIYTLAQIDYPPGYLYVLYLMGKISSIFDISSVGHIFYKLPALIFDILWIIFVHCKAKKLISSKYELLMVDFFASFAPSLIINSALWGQVDIIYLFFVVLFIDLLINNHTKSSFCAYAMSILIKPQGLVFAPILLFWAYENLIKDLKLKEIGKNFVWGIASLSIIVIPSIPFNLAETFAQYQRTLASYPYFDVNAFNIYSIFDLNFVPLPEWFSAVNTLIVASIVAYAFFCFLRGNKNYFFHAGMIAYAFYMLSTKIHERYCFPAAILFLMAYLYEKSDRNMYCFIFSSFTYITNVLCIFISASSVLVNNYAFSLSLSAINLLILIYILHCSFKAKSNI